MVTVINAAMAILLATVAETLTRRAFRADEGGSDPPFFFFPPFRGRL